MRNAAWLTCIALAVAATVTLGYAQPPDKPAAPPSLPNPERPVVPPPPPQGGPPVPPPFAEGGPPMPPPEIAEENREMIEQIMISRITRDLNLNDEQSVILMRRFGELREQQMQLRRERMEIMRELRPVLKQQQDEAKLKELMGRLQALNDKSAETEKTLRRAVEDMNLDIWQKARFEIFMNDFENQIRRLAQEARGGRPPLDRVGPGGRFGREDELPPDAPRRPWRAGPPEGVVPPPAPPAPPAP